MARRRRRGRAHTIPVSRQQARGRQAADDGQRGQALASRTSGLCRPAICVLRGTYTTPRNEVGPAGPRRRYVRVHASPRSRALLACSAVPDASSGPERRRRRGHRLHASQKHPARRRRWPPLPLPGATARASALSTPTQKNPTRPANSCAPAPASRTHHTAHRAHVNARVFSLLWCAPGARCRGWAILSRRPCAVRCGAVRCGPERGASVRSTGLSSVRPRLNSVTLTGRCEISGEPVRWCHGPVRLHVALFEGKRVL
jgi:hypothetical protein